MKLHSVIDLQNGELCLGGTMYHLSGVVHHIGSMNGGHYSASIKVNGRWKTCNDSRVKDDGGKNPKYSKTAYILLYEQVQVSESMVSPDQGCLAHSLPLKA
jgi:ubiquitin C-terminal hydrolase